jgi:hypothetical protein
MRFVLLIFSNTTVNKNRKSKGSERYSFWILWKCVFPRNYHHMYGTFTYFLPSFLPSFLPYLPTYLMEQRLSWEANTYSASQKISLILWSPEVRYRIYKIPQPLSILSQIDPVYAPQPTFRRSILMFFFHLRLDVSDCLLPSGFLTKTLYGPLLCPIRTTRFTHLSLLYLITRIIFGEEYRA